MNRYARHHVLEHFGKEKQELLSNAKVLIIGAGGLGCPVISYLAAAGVGTLGILDFDNIDLTNLQRQPIYNEEEVGQLKAEVATKKARELNSEIKVICHGFKLNESNALQTISSYDLVVDCSDNFHTRYLINDACIQLNKPWVFGSIEGWEGQVSTFNFNNGPSYRCLFPEQPMEATNCNEIGVLGPLAGVVGTTMALETIKIITQTGENLSGKLWVYDAFQNRNLTLEVKRNETEIARAKSEIRNLKSEITKEELVELMRTENYRIIDIREAHEFEENPSVYENIPYDEVLKMDFSSSSQNIIFTCSTGKRSRVVAQHLSEKNKYVKFFVLV